MPRNVTQYDLMFAMVVEALAAAMVAVPKKKRLSEKIAYNFAEKVRENNSGKLS